MHLWTLVPLFVALSATASPTFTPTGTVKDVKQAVATFPDAMVPFGSPKGVRPFEIQCPAEGTERWIDERTWAFDFKKPLPSGIRCEFKTAPNLKNLAGKALASETFRFDTGGPAISRIRPTQGSENIQEDQVFVLVLDGPIAPKSWSKGAYLEIEGLGEKIPLRELSQSQAAPILDTTWVDDNKDHVLLLQATRPLPASASVTLVWGKGISSPSGVETAQPQRFDYQVRSPFQVSFHCQRTNSDAPCNPLGRFSLRFSSPTPARWGKEVQLVGPGGETLRTDTDTSREDFRTLHFNGPLKPLSRYEIRLPPGIRDDFKRPLANASSFPLVFQTDDYSPLAKFPKTFGVIEWDGKSATVPLVLRGVEPTIQAKLLEMAQGKGTGKAARSFFRSVQGKSGKLKSRRLKDLRLWMAKVDRNYKEESVFKSKRKSLSAGKTFQIQREEGNDGAQVVGIPFEKPGFYVLEFETPRLSEALRGKTGKPFYVRTAVLITDLAVHFKRGKDRSLVWVTSLKSGEPVPNAKVRIWNCEGQELASLKTNAKGISTTTQSLESQSCSGEGYSRYHSGLWATAELGEDMAFTHSSWNDGIETWRYQLPSDTAYGDKIAHTVFDRTLLRAGETVSMKFFWRGRTSQGLSVPKKKPVKARIVHGPTQQEYFLPLKWRKDGTASGAWTIPKAAKLGTYEVYLLTNPKKKWENASGSFDVQAFKVPLMRAGLNPGKTEPVDVDSLDLSVSAEYLSGGGAANLPVVVRTQTNPLSWNDTDYSSYRFALGKVRTGKWKHGDQKSEDTGVRKWPLKLDATGAAKLEVDDLPESDKPFQIDAEMEFSDPNGEIQTVSRSIPVHPASVVAGLYADPWARHSHRATIFVQALDLKHKAAANRPVEVRVFKKNTFSNRKRLLGGYYSYDHFTEVKDAGEFCEGKTDASGRLICEAPLPESGRLVFQARIEDEKGRSAYTHLSLTAYGDTPVWHSVQNHDRLDVLAERNHYEPGEVARFQVRMPFPKATALVSVEREGILRSWVQTIEGKRPIVEVPIEKTDAPNLYVSVLAVRGRAAGPQPPGAIDLGKPAFRYGIGEVRVGWKPHRLKVRVEADRESYKVRDKAQVVVTVTDADGQPVQGEVALAAVDEGLLELKGNRSWRLLETMLARRAYRVDTATLNMHIVGKRHFGQKARAEGGDGGGGGAATGTTRELFDTLLLWKPRVKLDKKGKAQVSIPLNDSLTAFRIVAVGHEGKDRFGTGSSLIRTTQELMLFAGMPSVVRWGDQVTVPLTVRNAGRRPLSLAVTLKTEPSVSGLSRQTLELVPGESKEITWKLTIPGEAQEMAFAFEGSVDGKPLDSVKVTARSQPALPVRVVQGTLKRAEPKLTVPVEIPKGADPTRGGIRVQLDRSLAGSLSGVKAFFDDYPYTCLEQRVSKAVGLENKKLWDGIVKMLPTYLDGRGLAKYFPNMDEGSDTLTSYVLSVVDEAGWKIPGELRNRMLEGLRGFTSGQIVRRSPLPTADLVLRKIQAMEAMSRHLPKRQISPLVKGVSVRPNLWPTSTLLHWIELQRRLGNSETLKDAKRILRGRMVLQGTSLGFSTENQDKLWWLMASPDSNAVRTLLIAVDEADWKSEVPRLARGTVGRQQDGHWDLTTANAWGVLALRKFSRRFERVAVRGNSVVGLGKKSSTLRWKTSRPGVETLLPWPTDPTPLEITHKGAGSPWAFIQSLAAVPLSEPIHSGFQIKKEWIPVDQKTRGKWSRGDVVRVRLSLRAQDDRTWVAITDPVPVGASLLGSGLGRDSKMLTEGETGTWATFVERHPDRYQAYYRYRPGGEWTAEYTLRLNTPGTYQLPPTRVEAMYSPEVYGETPNPSFEIAP